MNNILSSFRSIMYLIKVMVHHEFEDVLDKTVHKTNFAFAISADFVLANFFNILLYQLPQEDFLCAFYSISFSLSLCFQERISHLTFQIPNSDQLSFEATHQGTVCLKPLIMKHISKSLRKPEREKLTQLRCISKEHF